MSARAGVLDGGTRRASEEGKIEKRREMHGERMGAVESGR
jgi:hypothetical protein